MTQLSDLQAMRFRHNDTETQTITKLEKLRLAALRSIDATIFNVSIGDLPNADPADPLMRFRVRDESWEFGEGFAEAGVGATGTPSLLIKKNSATVGTIAYVGIVGTVSFSDNAFASGDLFEIYPPAAPDLTLDQLSISLTVTIG